MPSNAAAPAVSVLVANHNGAAFLKDALKTILTQTLGDIEVVIVDDASTDHSRALIEDAARRDARVRLFTSAVQGGPGAARNIGLEHAAGRWIAVVDSDDLMHPERLSRLLQNAEAQGSDIAADNLLVFDDSDTAPPYAFLAGLTAPRAVDLAAYVRADAHGNVRQKLGYLKPLFRTGFIRRTGVRYPPGLKIAEDFSFVRSLLAAGARFHLFPDLTYFYRKHAKSISHRLKPADVHAMIADDARFQARHGAAWRGGAHRDRAQEARAQEVRAQGDAPPGLARAFKARRRGFQTALDYHAVVQAIKHRRWTRAAALALSNPRAGLMLRQAVAARIGRGASRSRPDAPPPVCMITQRPVTADAEQVLAPLIHLAGALGSAGFDAHLIMPSAVRPPRAGLSRIRSMRAFATVSTRPGRRKPPAAPGACWSTEETLFITRYGRPLAGVVVADWLPGVDAAPFTMRPASLLLVLIDGLPPEARLPAFAAEWAKLSRADAILATRADDGPVLRQACPGVPVILLPYGGLLAGALDPGKAALAAFWTRVWPSPPAMQRRAGG